MTSLAIVDTGPLVGAAIEDDDRHAASLDVLSRTDLQLVVPTFVAAEAAYLVGRWLGPSAQAQFVRGLGSWDISQPSAEEWPRMADLVEKYADFPLGSADASVVTLAERLDTDCVITFDHRHFRAIKPNHRDHLTLLP
jgi:predicted nucleic acid-binding protein